MKGLLRRGLAGGIFTGVLMMAGCGGGGGGTPAGVSQTGGNPVSAGAPNQVAVTVEQNPAITGYPTINLPYVSVTLCDTGGNCQTIDHIVVDTGSYGLRVLSGALGSPLNLPLQTASGGGTLGECATFLGGYMWGGVRLATIKFANETAFAIPVEVISDPALPVAPPSCQGTGSTDIGNLNGIGGNGLIGVGQFVEDQGSYYACTGAVCSPFALPAANQVSNPVAFFAHDNNGVILQMPSIPITGQATASGVLTLGIDTQSDNSLSGFGIIPADPQTGNFSATLTGQTYPNSFIDSGSDYNYITLPGLGLNGFGDYAPASYTLYPTVLSGVTSPGQMVSTQFGVIDTVSLNFGMNTAFNDVASPGAAGAADFGMPFFYGHSLAFVISGKQVTEGVGPLYALH